jgi:hypothetical protein
VLEYNVLRRKDGRRNWKELGGNYIMSSFIFVLFTNFYKDHQPKEDKLGGEFNRQGTDKKCI